MEIIVQKFGGTSVKEKSLRRQVVNHILKEKKEKQIPVVVVSAMGKNEGPYSTDKLIELIKEENENVAKRELDQIMSCGEIIASAVLAAGIQREGFAAISLTGIQAGIKTDGEYGNAEIIDIETNKIWQYIKENKIVVVAGFQGISNHGDTTTLGRGGSDTTASALGVYLRAKRVDIYTDVDGLMTADPKLVPAAEPIKEITFYEILQMAKEGAKIVHPKAVDFAMKNELPLFIKNTKAGNKGTKVISSLDNIKKYVNNNTGSKINGKITGIIHASSLVQVSIHFNTPKPQEDKVAILEKLNSAKINLKMLEILEDKIRFVISFDEFFIIIKELEERGLGKISHKNECARVTILHGGMEENNIFTAKALKILTRENITVFQTADSNVSTSFLISQENLKKASNLLHESFKK